MFERHKVEDGSEEQFGTDIGAIVVNGDSQGLGIVRNLSEMGIPVHVIDYELSIGRFSRCIQKFHKCPHVNNEEALVNFLIDLTKREGLWGWILFPTNDETVALLSRHKTLLSEYLRVWTPPWETISQVYDKRLTHQLADRVGVDSPKTVVAKSYEELNDIDIRFPAIIKPAVKDRFYAKTKSKALLANNMKELIKQFKRGERVVASEELMIQEVIPGGAEHLYSYCSLFKDGIPKAKLMARRARQHPMDFGHASTFVETINIPELEEASLKLLRAIDYYGLSEVEFKYDNRDGKYKLLEINARTWGWHSIGRRAGVNFSYLLYLDLIGENPVANGYREGIKWVRLATDVPTVFIEWRKGNMRIRDYLSSMRGEKEFAVFSLKDPLPFFVEFLIAPYLRKRRGF
ncbi:MAG: ATP-grasp domain-containing protein [Actinobacteria bacterium]|nr:ATP-grasp domain-containing protein [Actinomycetota bacterium]